MSDEQYGMDPVEKPAAVDQDDGTVLQGAGDFTSGEGLVAFAGMVLIALWVIFDVFLDDYGIGSLTLLLAALVVFAPRISRDTVAKVLPLPVIIKVAGYTLALIGVIEVVAALEGGFYEDALTIIAALVEYAAFVMAFIGARQIKI